MTLCLVGLLPQEMGDIMYFSDLSVYEDSDYTFFLHSRNVVLVSTMISVEMSQSHPQHVLSGFAYLKTSLHLIWVF